MILSGFAGIVRADLDEETFEQYVALLSETIDTDTSASDGARLIGLRELRDAALTPLFSQLASGRVAALRQQGMLAMAERASPPQLDLVMLAASESDAERAGLLSRALAEDLIDPGQLGVVLRWPGLNEQIELAVLAQLIGRGQPVDRDRVERLARSENADIRARGMLLMVALSETPRAELAALERELNALDPATFRNRVALLLDLIETHRLADASAFLEWMAVQGIGDVTLEAVVVEMLLRLAPVQGQRTWREAYEIAPSLGHRLRLANAALRAADSVGPEVFDVLVREDQSLLRTVGRAGRSVSVGSPDTSALIELARTEYVPALGWISDSAASWPTTVAGDVLSAMVRTAADRTNPRSPLSASAGIAIAELAEIDPARLAPFLESAVARLDLDMTGKILAELLSANRPPIWDVANPPQWPSQQTEALAILLQARRGAALSTENEAALTRIPIGWGRLSPGHRMQAAWLAAARNDRGAELLARAIASAASQ